jgi:large subunit ribosomal protein L23
MQLSYVLKKPLVTEKTTFDMEERNRYAFLVDRRATKADIRRAVETVYGVKVEDVSTMRRKGGSRRLRYGWVNEGVTKKAVVRLREGDSIDLF